MGMNKTLAITTISLVAVIMVVGAIIPAMAAGDLGKIHSINKAEKHGVIERTGDGSGTLYQFTIPRDLDDPSYVPKVGDIVGFNIDPENSRHATVVVKICLTPPCPSP